MRPLLEHLVKAGITTVRVENGPVSPEPIPGVDTIWGHGNVGYGSAANLGMCALLRRGLSVIYVANSDVLPSPQALRWMQQHVPESEFIGFPLKTEYGTEARSVGVIPSPVVALFTALASERRALSVFGDRTYPKGALIGIPSAALWAGLGWFDSDFFLYFEEVDLARRLTAAGYRVVIAPSEAVVCHLGGEATSSSPLLMALELGRSAGLYCLKRRSPALLVALSIQFGILALRAAATAKPRLAMRWLASCLAVPLGLLGRRFEPLRFSRLRPVPVSVRSKSCAGVSE